jgi:hypothetical protein
VTEDERLEHLVEEMGRTDRPEFALHEHEKQQRCYPSCPAWELSSRTLMGLSTRLDDLAGVVDSEALSGTLRTVGMHLDALARLRKSEETSHD